MANLTLAEARTKVRQFIDDSSATAANQRWSDTQIDDALKDNLSACLVRYATAGGDRFDLETTGTTSATDGSLSLSSVVPLVVKQIGVNSGNTIYRVSPKDSMRRGYADLVARDLVVLYVREYALPTTTSHPLVGVGASAANSWPDFDRWVCMEASCQLSIKDMEVTRLQVLQQERERCAKSALGRPRMPSGYQTPRPEWSPILDGVAWQLVQPSTIYLTRVRW